MKSKFTQVRRLPLKACGCNDRVICSWYIYISWNTWRMYNVHDEIYMDENDYESCMWYIHIRVCVYIYIYSEIYMICEAK